MCQETGLTLELLSVNRRGIFASYFKLLVRWLPRSPQSLTYVSFRGFTVLPPPCNSNYLAYSMAARKNFTVDS
ncbi:hypothetical protein F6Q07_15980 [Pectobacterium parmentieri]|nr:hypothetical protein C5E26_11125 [Pectobacterium parmentieri]AYH27716.1 hypothetical protein C5E20_11530 [Pectobacterium parmentieri]AYH32021.1 hypothetical protein C5E19_10560 [Pectobacterium parmentieri]MBI0519630.1 hypothetical protein [Pectobacterium parmentieri]